MHSAFASNSTDEAVALFVPGTAVGSEVLILFNPLPAYAVGTNAVHCAGEEMQLRVSSRAKVATSADSRARASAATGFVFRYCSQPAVIWIQGLFGGSATGIKLAKILLNIGQCTKQPQSREFSSSIYTHIYCCTIYLATNR